MRPLPVVWMIGFDRLTRPRVTTHTRPPQLTLRRPGTGSYEHLARGDLDLARYDESSPENRSRREDMWVIGAQSLTSAGGVEVPYTE